MRDLGNGMYIKGGGVGYRGQVNPNRNPSQAERGPANHPARP